MFTVTLTNFNNQPTVRSVAKQVWTFEQAVDDAKLTGFECTISDRNGPCASYSPIGGLRHLRDYPATHDENAAFTPSVYRDPSIQEIEAMLTHPNFRHCRAGDRLMRDLTLVYHYHPTSPTGVHLLCSVKSSLLEPVMRRVLNNSPLSPTERY